MTWTRLHDACQHQKSSTVVKLAHACAEEALMVDDHGSTPLHIACWGNPPVDVIQALLDACPQTVADQDVDGNNPLHIAASHPEMSVEVIRALLEACPVAVSAKNKEGLMPLHMACRNAPRNEPVIAVLIEAYPQALETRTKMGHMVQRRSSPNNSDDGHENPHLHFVSDMAEKSNLELAATRYSLGEQVRDGSYPLLMAIENGATCAVIETILHGHREDLLRLTNKFGETALHLALKNHPNENLVAMLIQSSLADFLVHAKEKKHGNLPIHAAAMMGCSPTVMTQLLCLHPDSIFEKNVDGKTPLDIAVESKHCPEEVVRLLEITEHHESLETSIRNE